MLGGGFDRERRRRWRPVAFSWRSSGRIRGECLRRADDNARGPRGDGAVVIHSAACETGERCRNRRGCRPAHGSGRGRDRRHG